MPVVQMPMFQILEQVMRFHNFRHDIVAGNIANANTPGYRAFDVVLQETIDGVKPTAPRMGDRRHMTMTGTEDATGARLVRSRALPRLDGNNVDLDGEIMRMNENQLRYGVALELRDRLGALVPLAREVR